MTKGYFSGLNYSSINEDTSFELSVLPAGTNHVLAIAGSGSRVLPLLSKNPLEITCVDISPEQIFFTELKFATLKRLDRTEFIDFWGYLDPNMTAEKRKKTFQSLVLSKAAKTFAHKLFENYQWGPLLYVGKWERAIRKISAINRLIMGKSAREIFGKNSMTPEFPWNKLKFSTCILGNIKVLNGFLYKGSLPTINTGESLSQFYFSAISRLLSQHPPRESFLLQMLFLGSLKYKEALPLECDQKIYRLSQKALENTKINYRIGNFFETVNESKRKIDFISLSDLPSYFKSGDHRLNFLRKIKQKLSNNAMVVCRYYLNRLNNIDARGFSSILGKFNKEIMAEQTQMYTYDVYKKTA